MNICIHYLQVGRVDALGLNDMSISKSKSLRYILASPGYAPGTIAVNVTVHGRKEDSMLVKRIAAYPQPFPSNSIRKSKSSPF